MRARFSRFAPLPLAAALFACSQTPAPLQRLDADPPPAEPEATLPPGWENPGGMWTPEQLPDHAETLKELGFAITGETLSDPTAFPLGAIIFLGGCSASFVSPRGLVVTNHHCVTTALQLNSSEERNLAIDGFLARKLTDEVSAGPTARVYVTQRIEDVTGRVREGLDRIADDTARFEALENRQKQIVAACEEGRPSVRCSVAPFFEGAEYRLIEQLEIRDVRIVYAPANGIGNYGGEIDNWRWPRHSGDFAFYRAYVGPDGEPADPSPANVPYQPKHVLKLASEPLGPGDPVMVAGYPAVTSRYTTQKEVERALAWQFPWRIKLCQEYLAALEAAGKVSADAKIKADPLVRGLGNWLTNTRGMVDGLEKGGLAAKRGEADRALREFVDADPTRKARYAPALDALDRLVVERQRTAEADALLWEAQRFVKLLGAAVTIVRMAEERPKPDTEREPAYQARNHKQLEQGMVQLSQQLSTPVERALLTLLVRRELELPSDRRVGIARTLLGDKPATPANIDASVRLFTSTKLDQEATRLDLFRRGTIEQLATSHDPMIQLAMSLRPALEASEQRDKRFAGAMSVHRPLFVEALREHAGGRLAPDANRTLRITYGTVRGYRPSPDAPMHEPFTALGGVLAKHTGVPPFDAPAELIAARKEGKVGTYVDRKLGDVPVNFLADLDITGGNSGSATLNKHGELVGLAFDGNYEAMATDWLFIPEVTRSIHVDLRYMLWVLDAVDGADELLRELGRERTLR